MNSMPISDDNIPDTAQSIIFSPNKDPLLLERFLESKAEKVDRYIQGCFVSLNSLLKFKGPEDEHYQFGLDCLEVLAKFEKPSWSESDGVWLLAINFLCADYRNMSFNYAMGQEQPKNAFIANVMRRFPAFLTLCNELRDVSNLRNGSMVMNIVSSIHVLNGCPMEVLKSAGLDFNKKGVHGTPLFALDVRHHSSVDKALWLINECGNDPFERMKFVLFDNKETGPQAEYCLSYIEYLEALTNQSIRYNDFNNRQRAAGAKNLLHMIKGLLNAEHSLEAAVSAGNISSRMRSGL